MRCQLLTTIIESPISMDQPIIVTLDAETYYDRAFSLSKMTIEHYCRDPRFEVIMLGAKFGGSPSRVAIGPSKVAAAVARVDWNNTIIVGQNTAFDGFLLHHHYGVKPKAWVDIMGMSRALFPHERHHSLKAQAERMGIGSKGDEVHAALGKRFADFTPAELDKYAGYCSNDVDLTYALFEKYMGMGFPTQELKLIDLTLRMFIEPVLVLDNAQLTKHLHEVRARKAALIDRVRDSFLRGYTDPEAVQALFTEGVEGIKKMLMSNDRFARALVDLGVDPPRKVSPTTGRETWAFAKTDEGFKALEEHPDADVQALVAARLGNKTTLEETRTERFIGMATRGSFPVPLRYYGAHSGRWSGEQSVNLQNLPARGANAGRIKKAIMAPPGHVVIDCDSAQIEARVLSWLARQDDLTQAFANGDDVYSMMASRIYGRHVDRKRVEVGPDGVEVNPDKTEGHVGKTVVLGGGYGVGHVKTQAFLKTQAGVAVDLGEAKRIIDAYRHSVPKITALWKRATAALVARMNGQEADVDPAGVIRAYPGKGLRLPSGLYIQYPDLRAVTAAGGKQEMVYTSKGLPVRIYGGKVVENCCQALARQIIAEQMLRVAKRYRVVLTVHDAIAIVAPVHLPTDTPTEDLGSAVAQCVVNVAIAQQYLESCMSWVPAWAPGLPLACESGVGMTYGDC